MTFREEVNHLKPAEEFAAGPGPRVAANPQGRRRGTAARGGMRLGPDPSSPGANAPGDGPAARSTVTRAFGDRLRDGFRATGLRPAERQTRMSGLGRRGALPLPDNCG